MYRLLDLSLLIIALLIPFCPAGSEVVAECDMARLDECSGPITITQADYVAWAQLPHQIHWRVDSRDLLITRHIAFSPQQIGELRDVRPWALPGREYRSGREYGIPREEGPIESVVWCGRPGYPVFVPTFGSQ